MSGINPNIVYSINRLKSKFHYNGNFKNITGSGFWINIDNNNFFFVTNKHNVDPTLKFGDNTKYTLNQVELELRQCEGKTKYSKTQFFTVDNLENSLFKSEAADCAIIINPEFYDKLPDYNPCNEIPIRDLADDTFLKSKVQYMDLTSFIGFPGNSNSEWWDLSWNIPIARIATISSLPSRSIENNNIQTGDTVLVNGFSFSGSSGSPIILHQKGVLTGIGPGYPEFVEPKIIGIMSGHYKDEEEEKSMFKHTGLSYFTRSTSIIELLKEFL